MTSRGVALSEVAAFLDGYLRISEVPDEPQAVNGLQAQNTSGTVRRIVAAVDASSATIAGVTAQGHARGTLLLVHHGLFWRGCEPLTGRHFQRVAELVTNDVAVYSAHIPLDVHLEVGNNAVLARDIGITAASMFDTYRGVPMGVMGDLALPVEELMARLEHHLGSTVRLIPGGPATTAKVGVITGAAGNRVRAAGAAGCDTFITGEGPHHTYHEAMDAGINLLYAGHYATETVGVKALAKLLSEKYGVPWEFHDHPTGM